MLVNLDPGEARPLYLQIMDEVRRSLVIGTLKPEDPVPSVRELASELVVNPRTVLQAYRELEREGVLYVRRGQGTFVASGAQPSVDDRRELGLGVARRALLEGRRNGFGLEELVDMMRDVAAEESDLAAQTTRSKSR